MTCADEPVHLSETCKTCGGTGKAFNRGLARLVGKLTSRPLNAPDCVACSGFGFVIKTLADALLR